MKSEWLAKLRKVLNDAESAEKILSYNSRCETENFRKQSGSYFTPVDVSRFFWNEIFNLTNLNSVANALAFIRSRVFVEPAVGSGILFFALLEKLTIVGLKPANLAEIKIDLIDVNGQSLRFVEARINELERSTGVNFVNVSYICSDFRKTKYPKSTTPLVFFGNPPFVTNMRGTSVWKNLFADFLEISLDAAGLHGSVHYILPLSIAFSRDYSELRSKLYDHPRVIGVSHFDNVPDALFKYGKPRHHNTNRSNSQRCSILNIMPSEKPQILSTELHRWYKNERENILGSSPEYLDVTDYCFDDQIPRPKHKLLLNYLDQAHNATTLGKLFVSEGKYSLYVASVARNFIGIRESVLTNVHKLRFDRIEDFYKVLVLVTSDLFYDYWLTVGDGFHVTKKNIHEFPIKDALLEFSVDNLSTAQRLWKNREHYAKRKLNCGIEIRTFDFSSALPSVYKYLKSNE